MPSDFKDVKLYKGKTWKDVNYTKINHRLEKLVSHVERSKHRLRSRVEGRLDGLKRAIARRGKVLRGQKLRGRSVETIRADYLREIIAILVIVPEEIEQGYVDIRRGGSAVISGVVRKSNNITMVTQIQYNGAPID